MVIRILFFILLQVLLLAKIAAQTISTFGGTGLAGNTGDNGLATAAKINYPVGGVFDKDGNYYFALGSVGNRIKKISFSGIITTVAGTGTAGYNGDGGQAIFAELNFPHDITVDSVGNLFIADAQNNRVRKVDIATGLITTIAGDGSANNSGDGGPASLSALYSPFAVCFDNSGNLYISAGNRIRKVNTFGIISTIAGTGVAGHSGDGGAAINAQISSPHSLCSDDNGDLYIADKYFVRKISHSTGIINTVAGNGGTGGSTGDGGPALAAQINAERIALDKAGNLFIGEDAYKKVRKVNGQGVITTVAGTGVYGDNGDGGLAVEAEIKTVFGLTTDTCGNLYIADGHSFRIRKVSFNPNCWPLEVNVVKPLSFSVSPNPASGYITIHSASKLKEIRVCNSLGQQMLQAAPAGERTGIDISSLAPGFYFVTVTDVNGVRLSRKLLKE